MNHVCTFNKNQLKFYIWKKNIVRIKPLWYVSMVVLNPLVQIMKYLWKISSFLLPKNDNCRKESTRFTMFFRHLTHGTYSPARAETRYSNHLVTVYRIVYKEWTTINRPCRTLASIIRRLHPCRDIRIFALSRSSWYYIFAVLFFLPYIKIILYVEIKICFFRQSRILNDHYII